MITSEYWAVREAREMKSAQSRDAISNHRLPGDWELAVYAHFRCPWVITSHPDSLVSAQVQVRGE